MVGDEDAHHAGMEGGLWQDGGVSPGIRFSSKKKRPLNGVSMGDKIGGVSMLELELSL